MKYINTGVHDAWFPTVHGFRFGADHRVWYFDGKHKSVCSVDLESMLVQRHFVDESITEFGIFGGLGAVGTIDGRVWTFRIHELPEISPVLWFSDRHAIGGFDFDPVSESLFVVCENQVHRVALDGERLGCWECEYPCGGIKLITETQTIWSYCSGIEILSLEGADSRAIKQGKFCPYTGLAVSPKGEVAAFGGDVDIFTADGQLISAISGDYNGGEYHPNGRLVVKETLESPDLPITFTSHDNYDVISNCDRFAFDQKGGRMAAIHWGKLFRFDGVATQTP